MPEKAALTSDCGSTGVKKAPRSGVKRNIQLMREALVPRLLVYVRLADKAGSSL